MALELTTTERAVLRGMAGARLAYPVVPFLELATGSIESWEDGTRVRVGADGVVETTSNGREEP